MMRGLKLLLLLSAVPLVAMFTSHLVRSEIESEWVKLVVKEFGVEAGQIREVQTLCTTIPEFRQDFSEVCTTMWAMGLMSRVATGALVLGIVLVAVIALAGRVARNQRELLWKVFGPGLRLTIFALVGLITLHAALAMASIWYGESALTGRVHVQIIGLIGIGALSGVLSMSKTALKVVREVSSSVFGRPLSREAHPALWQFVDRAAHKLGTEPPQHIIAGLFPSFFVTEADVTHPTGVLRGRTLYLSLPLCRVLSRGELEAIIGHELGHFRGADTAFSRRFYPIYRGSEEALVALVQHTGGARSIALMPAIYTLGFFLESFQTAESEVSREREFMADQAGAEAAGTRNMAAALAKVHAFTGLWDQVADQFQESHAQGQPMPNVSLHFAEVIQAKATPQALDGLDREKLPHPVDSHPPLSQRLSALQANLAEVVSAALNVSPEEPAFSLFTQPEMLELQLTEEVRQLMTADT